MIIRTLDSSQRDVPVYVVFRKGVLTVPVGCLCQLAVWPSETLPQGVLVPVLLQAHAGAQETLRPGAGACQGTNLTAKRGLKAPF